MPQGGRVIPRWIAFVITFKILKKIFENCVPRARSAQKRLRLFSEKSAILVRFHSNSGLEPIWIPNEEFMKGARFARAPCARSVR